MGALLISLLLLFSFEPSGPAASIPAVPANQYGQAVVHDVTTYRALARDDHGRYLVDLARFVPGLRLDLAYARGQRGGPPAVRCRARVRDP